MLKLFKFIYFYLRNFKYIFISNKRIFENIYKKNEWGTNNKSQFYSGSGSHDDSYITNYINTINSFISNKNYTVIDFGTGDFNISKHIAPNAKKFVGIDIVKPLINHLKSKYSSEKIDFCVYKNEILDADVILVKEVFQHLSNQKISKILSQIKCKHLIVTEKVPLNKGLPNIDKPSSKESRGPISSYVDIALSPFNLNDKQKKILLKHERHNKDFLNTTVYSF